MEIIKSKIIEAVDILNQKQDSKMVF